MSSSLWTGPYGDMEEVRLRTRHVYDRAGFPKRASDLAVHPMLDNFIWGGRSPDATRIPSGDLLVPVLGDPYSPDRWYSRDHPADADLTRHISEEAKAQFELEEEPTTPDGVFADRISTAYRLLSDTVPEVWENTSPFVTRVFDIPSDRANSASLDHTGGAILLSSVTINNETDDNRLVALAEFLLHEAVHSKSYRIFRAFRTMNAPDSPNFIDVPWWRVEGQSWEWDVDRSIAASHVYSHLATFYDRLSDTRPQMGRRRQQAAFRAQFLTNILVQLPKEILDDEWRDFVKWIAATILPVGKLTEAGSRELSRPLSSFPNYRI